MESFFTELELKIGVEKIVEIIKKNEKKFSCAKCGCIPHQSFISSDCEHNFCEKCVNRKPFFKQCPKCNKVIREENIINDHPYTVFSQCYRQYKHVLLGPLDSESKNVRISKKNNNFYLQEECRKLFKNRGGSLDNVRKLLSSGANPNVLNKDGWTLMHEAVDYGNLEILELLLAYGGNVNAYSSDNCTTCLHDALNEINISTEIIKCLLSFGADIHARDYFGMTPMQKVSENPDLLKLFQEHKKIYDIPVQSIPSKVPLIYGCNLTQASFKNLSSFCQTYKLKLAAPGKKISKDVTHVIVEEEPCQPRHEILIGMLYGCYIVSHIWIEESLKEGRVLPPENFEVTGTREYPASNGPKKSRLNSESLKPRLFASGQFYIMDGMEQKLLPKKKEELVELITAGGGKILTRAKSFDELTEKPVFFHANVEGPLKFCSVIVLFKVKPPIVYRMDTVRSFHITWLYHAIQTFNIQDTETEIFPES